MSDPINWKSRALTAEARASAAEEKLSLTFDDDLKMRALKDQEGALMALEAQLSSLRRGLEPFLATAEVLDAKPRDSAVWAGQKPAPPLTFGHFRTLRSLLQQDEEVFPEPAPDAQTSLATSTHCQSEGRDP